MRSFRKQVWEFCLFFCVELLLPISCQAFVVRTWKMLKRCSDNKVATFNTQYTTDFFFGWFCIHSFLKKQPHLWLSGQLRNVKILQISNRQKEAGKLCVTVSFDRFQNKWFDMFQFPNRWETPGCSEVTISRGLLFMRTFHHYKGTQARFINLSNFKVHTVAPVTSQM